MFSDKKFDMVLSFDTPISYTYPYHEEVIKNLALNLAKTLDKMGILCKNI